MTTIFGFQLPSFGHNSYFNSPDKLLNAKAEKKLQEALNGAPDPSLQKLFQTSNESGELLETQQRPAQTSPMIEQPTNSMVNTAVVVDQVVEANFIDEAVPVDLINTAQAVVETAETTMKPYSLIPVGSAKKAVLSRMVSSGVSALKAAPSKAFYFLALPVIAWFHNEYHHLSNVHFLVNVTSKKVIHIKIGANNREKFFEFTVAPGDKLKFSDQLQHDCVSTQLMPSFANTTGLLGRLFSPLTSMVSPRVNDQRVYSVLVKDPVYNPFLAEKPIVKTIQLSSDEILRITHESGEASTLKREDLHLASDEEIESEVPEQWDKLNLINIKITDDELFKHVTLPTLPGNQGIEYITIEQRFI